jgi:hypothetical protein
MAKFLLLAAGGVYYNILIAYLFKFEVFGAQDLSLKPSGPEEQETNDNINNNPRLIEFACPRSIEMTTLYIREPYPREFRMP